MDVKCPVPESTGRCCGAFLSLSDRDEVKFVIATSEDYRYAKEVLQRHAGSRAGGPLLARFGSSRPTSSPTGSGGRAGLRLQLQIHSTSGTGPPWGLTPWPAWGSRRGSP